MRRHCWSARSSKCDPGSPVLHHPRSFFPTDLSHQVGGSAEILWVVDELCVEDSTSIRLMRKLGTVVDIAGLDVDQAATRIAAHKPEGIVSFVDDHVELGRGPGRAARPHVSHARGRGDPGRQAPAARRLARRRYRGPGLLVDAGRTQCGGGRSPGAPHQLPGRAQTGRRQWQQGHRARYEPGGTAVAAERRRPQDRPPPRGLHPRRRRLRPVVRELLLVRERDQRGAYQSRRDHRSIPAREPFRETGNFVPGILAPELHAPVSSMVDDTIRALGIRDAVIHTEIKLTADGPKLVEVNGRLGGRAAIRAGSRLRRQPVPGRLPARGRRARRVRRVRRVSRRGVLAHAAAADVGAQRRSNRRAERALGPCPVSTR